MTDAISSLAGGNMTDPLTEKAQRIFERTSFLGGGIPQNFSSYGRAQLITLLRQGLHPESRLLEIGCGCLRAGYWFIHLLNPGRYHGIEPNRELLQAGKEILFDSDILEQKRPSFDHNTEFDLGVFGTRFDFFVARSIWTHTSKRQIQSMLDGFVANSNDGAVFLTSYKDSIPLVRPDYKGDTWVGESHESKVKGIVRHSFLWIRRQCEDRGLTVVKLKQDNFRNQKWLRIDRRNQAG